MNRIGATFLAGCGLVMLLLLTPSVAWPQSEQQASGVGNQGPSSPAAATTDEGKKAPATAPSQPSVEEVERSLKDLKAKVTLLDGQSKAAGKHLSDLKGDLGRAEQRLFVLSTGQKLLHPTRFLSPLVTNIGFIFGGIALLIIVVTRSATARTLLSLRYPFSVQVRRPDSTVKPMTEGARWVWGLVLLLILFLLALPAFSQEAAAATSEGTPEAVKSDATPATTSAPAVQAEMDKAASLIEMTPVERAILVMESAPESSEFKVLLDKEVLERIQAAAKQHNHLPLMDIQTPVQPVMSMDLKKNTPGYYIVLASLYEAANRPTACETLTKGIQPFTADPSALRNSMPFEALNAVLLWLADCNTKDLAKVFIPAVAEKAPDLQGVRGVVEIAEKLGLAEETRKAIEVNIPRFGTIDGVEGLAELAQQKGFNDLAAQVLETNVPRFELEGRLRLIRRLHKLVDAAKIESLLAIASGSANLDGIISIAETAAELGLEAKAKDMLGVAFRSASGGEDAEKILASAAKMSTPPLDYVHPLMKTLQEGLASRANMADWYVAARIPGEFGAATLDKEKASLACVVAVNLFTPENQAALRPLFEQPVMRQLEGIVQSMGAQQQMRINDLYILARYYELTNDPALEATRRMVALQQRLRGLDMSGASDADAKRLAMLMEMEQLRSQESMLQEMLADTKHAASEVEGKLSEVRFKIAVLLCEALAKIVLVALGLWMALSRAIAAARDAKNWVFSIFCWKFFETLGFELCCTVVLVPFGVPAVLLSQDRLKHLSPIELPPDAAPSSIVLTAPVETLAQSPSTGE